MLRSKIGSYWQLSKYCQLSCIDLFVSVESQMQMKHYSYQNWEQQITLEIQGNEFIILYEMNHFWDQIGIYI